MTEEAPVRPILRKIIGGETLTSAETKRLCDLFKKKVNQLRDDLQRYFEESRAEFDEWCDPKAGSAEGSEALAASDGTPDEGKGRSANRAVHDRVFEQTCCEIWLHFTATSEGVKSVWQSVYESGLAEKATAQYLIRAAENHLKDLCWGRSKPVSHALNKTISDAFRNDAEVTVLKEGGRIQGFVPTCWAGQADTLPRDPINSLDFVKLRKQAAPIEGRFAAYGPDVERKPRDAIAIALPSPAAIKVLIRAACEQKPCVFTKRGLAELLTRTYGLAEPQAVAFPEEPEETGDRAEGKAAFKNTELHALSQASAVSQSDLAQAMTQAVFAVIEAEDGQPVDTRPGQPPGGLLAHVLADCYLWDRLGGEKKNLAFPEEDKALLKCPAFNEKRLSEKRIRLDQIIQQTINGQHPKNRMEIIDMVNLMFGHLRDLFMHRMPENLKSAYSYGSEASGGFYE